MEDQILQKIEEQSEKIEVLTRQVNKVRKYFLIIIWVTVIMFVVPLIGAAFIIPTFLSTYLGALEGLI